MNEKLTRILCVVFIGSVWLAARVLAADEVTVTFKYSNPNAKSVGVAGEFSDWGTLPMTKDESGAWSRTFQLKPGTYAYKFVVNGTDWVFDPNNPARKSVN